MLRRFADQRSHGRCSTVALTAASLALRCATAMLVVAAGAATASAQMMSLPGKFNVTATGATTYSVPIAVPPGTAGMAPALTLDYSSQGGNGIIGMGWSLGGLPAIGRCPRTMVQDGVVGAVNYDANDRFCLDGQRLIVISGTYGADGAEYRTEVETFNRIISHGTAGTGPASFEVHTKSGQVMYFATTTDSRPLTQTGGTARSWQLSSIQDSKGNYLNVQYTNDAANGQAYPINISYTGSSAAGLAPYNSVQLVYQTRPDITPIYHAGSVTRSTVRLTNIQTFAGSTLVGNYVLAYEQGPGSLRSRVTSIKLCAADGSCLPATTFAWTNGGTGTFTQFNQVLPKNLGLDSTAFVGDFNGDGKADFIAFAGNGDYSTSTFETFLSNGDRTFTNVEQIISGVDLSQVPVVPPIGALIMGDFNADGKADFSVVPWPQAGPINTFLGNGDGTFGLVQQAETAANSFTTVIGGDYNSDGKTDFLWIYGSVFWKFISVGDGTFAQSSMMTGITGRFQFAFTGDFNGDGRADFIIFYNNTIYTYLGNPDGTFTQVNQTIGFSFAPPTYWTPIVGDFNGDGKTDVCWISGSTFEVFLSKGDGTFLNVVQTVAPANFGNPPSAAYMPVSGDFNGDGKTDFTLVAPTAAYTFLSKGDGTFTAAPTTLISGYNPALSSFTLPGDFRGVGKTDVAFVLSSTLAGLFSDGGVPDLLASITTGLGAATSITYAPLTQSSVYTKDATATYPTQDISGAIYVTSRVDTANGVGGTYSTTYKYAGAKGDLTGRGFLGFRQMTATDLQTNLVETTSFRQDFPYIGNVASKTKTLGAQTLNQTANTYQLSNSGGAASISTPSVTSAPYRVSLSQTVASSSDLDGTAMPTVTTTNQYDAFGNPTQIVVSTPDGFSKTTTNTYTNDTTHWYLGRLTGATVTSTTP
jgi:hypothetical protein